jgi:DNA-binding PadR family transcriptional regulator
MFGHHHGRGAHGHHHGGPRGGGGGGLRGPFGVAFAMGEWLEGSGQGLGRGRGRRMFDGGELRLVLLRMIADEPRHGYELIKAIEELTGGAYVPSPGVVYPALSMLAEMGLIGEQESEGSKKRFAVTDEGLRHLHQNREVVDALMKRLAELGARTERTDAGPIRRSMGNLRVALQNRLSRGDLSDDTLHDVAALLDEVSQKIERLR